MKIKDDKCSYREIGFWGPKFRKYKRIGFLNLPYFSYRIRWYLVTKFHYVTKFPIHMDFETTNYCNLKCIMCPHSLDKSFGKQGIMDFELYKKIIDQGVNNGLKSVKLNIRGEPLLHPKLIEMVKYAKDKGILEVMFNTNGLLLTPERTEKLIEAGIDYIIISIDGATKETYEKIRQGGKFDDIITNLNFLIMYRKKNRLKKPLIRLQYVKMKDNEHEVKDYYRMWQGKVDVMTVNAYSDRTNEPGRALGDMQVIGRLNCNHPWRRLSVSWQGEALICCADWYLKSVVGDTNIQSIKEIWHSEKFNQIRDCLRKRELDKINACKECFAPGSYKWGKRQVKTYN